MKAATGAPGLFARKLAADASIRDNRIECNRVGIDDVGGTGRYSSNRLVGNTAASSPIDLAQGGGNSVTPGNCSAN